MKKFLKPIYFLAAALLISLISACADAQSVQACVSGREYGFFSGLLHGFITPISFVSSLFNKGVAIYAVNNSGAFYDLGFLLGSSGWGFLAGNRSKGR